MTFDHLVERWSKIRLSLESSTEELSCFTISNYVKNQQFKENFDIAAAGNYFPLKKMLKRWPYLYTYEAEKWL